MRCEEAWEIAGFARRVIEWSRCRRQGRSRWPPGLELANGHRAITDPGARARPDWTSLAEGVAAHRAAVARRLEAAVVVQFDEPSLPAALGWAG